MKDEMETNSARECLHKTIFYNNDHSTIHPGATPWNGRDIELSKKYATNCA